MQDASTERQKKILEGVNKLIENQQKIISLLEKRLKATEEKADGLQLVLQHLVPACVDSGIPFDLPL